MNKYTEPLCASAHCTQNNGPTPVWGEGSEVLQTIVVQGLRALYSSTQINSPPRVGEGSE